MVNVLQPQAGVTDRGVYLRAAPEAASWGPLPNAADVPVLAVGSGPALTVDTLGQEGRPRDQGGDRSAYGPGTAERGAPPLMGLAGTAGAPALAVPGGRPESAPPGLCLSAAPGTVERLLSLAAEGGARR